MIANSLACLHRGDVVRLLDVPACPACPQVYACDSPQVDSPECVLVRDGGRRQTAIEASGLPICRECPHRQAGEKSEVRSQKTEVRSPTSDLRRPTSEALIDRVLASRGKPSLAAMRAAEYPPAGYEWISTARLVRDTLSLVGRLPADLAGVVGVPRSGMIPASVLATALHVPLYELDLAGQLRRLGHGSRGRAFGFPAAAPERQGRLLVVDDTVYGGNSMHRARGQLDRLGLDPPPLCAAIYVRSATAGVVDIYGRVLESPQLLEWNVLNNGILAGHARNPILRGGIGLDLDGVICHDPTVPDADEGPGLARYGAWLDAAAPRLLPRTIAAPLILTARLGLWRERTEAWLAQWGCQYELLVMHPAARASERGDFSQVAAWKAEQLASLQRTSDLSWYIESDDRQAQRISQLWPTGRVICPATERVYAQTDL